jgi:hypothetical protein
LLLILICIVFEIHGDPYLMETPKHQVLGRLELSALMIEWGTMWSGLVIFQLDDSQPSDKGFAITLTIVVILTNTILLICFVVQFIRAKIHERKEAARLAAMAAVSNLEKKRSFFGTGFSVLRKKLSSIGGDSVQRWRFNNMSREAQQKDIRRRTIDANDSTTSVNPVTIEMPDMFPSESVSTGEIKVDDDAAAVDGGGSSFMRSPPPPPTPASVIPRRQSRLESGNATKKGLTFKNPTTRNNQTTL